MLETPFFAFLCILSNYSLLGKRYTYLIKRMRACEKFAQFICLY